MAVTKGTILYNGKEDRELLVTEMKSYGTSLKNDWINTITDIKTKYKLPKATAGVDVLKGYDCTLVSTSDVNYSELEIEVFKYMLNFSECNDIFEGTMYEDLYASGGLAEIPREALQDLIINPLMAQAGKEFGKAVWQAVQAVTVDATTPIIQVFDGLEKKIADGSANVQTLQPAITTANVIAQLDAFIEYIGGIADSEDWFFPADDLTNTNYPAIWMDKKSWRILKQVAYGSDFKDAFDFGETPEPFKGSYKGFTIYADSLTEGTWVAGKRSNFHVGVDASRDNMGSDMRIEEVPNTNQFKLSMVDRVGTLVTLPNQVAMRTL